MNSRKKAGIKSAYELAMERLGAQPGAAGPVSAEQKAELARVDSEMRAGIAEVEIMMQSHLAEARAAGDPEKLKQVEDEKVSRISKLRAQAEERRQAIRSGGRAQWPVTSDQ